MATIAERSVGLFAEAFANNSRVGVEWSATLGRGLVSRSSVNVGDTLVDGEAPAAAALLSDVCHECLQTDATKRCSACQWAFFCSATCQRAAWSAHKPDCRAVAGLPAEARQHVEPSTMLAVRVAWLFIRERQSPRVQRIATLLSNAAHLTEAGTAALNAEAMLASRILFLQEAPDTQYVSVPFLTSILATVATNAIGICETTEYTDIGVGLYDRLALLNHSCDPNCVVVFERTNAVLRAVKPIDAGEQLTISYIDRATDRNERRKQLAARYHFECACARCAGPPGADVFDVALRCTATPRCDGQVVQTDASSGVCSVCAAQQPFVAPPAATSQEVMRVNAFDDAERTVQYERLLQTLHPRSLAVRRFLQAAERDALHAALRGAVPYRVVFRWSALLLEHERRRVGDAADTALSKQVFAAGRLALEAGEFGAAAPLLREALKRMNVTCTSQKMLRDVWTYVVEAEQRLKA